MPSCVDLYSCARVVHTRDVVLACRRIDNITTSVAPELKLFFPRAHSTSTLKDSPQEAAWPPTHHVRRHQSPTYDAQSAQARYIQRAHIQHAHGDLHERRAERGVRTFQAHSAGARAATALAAARTHSVATRRHATSMRPRRIGATRPRRAPRRRCRPARRPLSRPPRVPCASTACQYLRRNERRTGHPQTPARDVQPTARRRGRSASTKRPFRRWAGTSATRAGSCASAVIHMMPADMLHARTPTSPPEAAA